MYVTNKASRSPQSREAPSGGKPARDTRPPLLELLSDRLEADPSRVVLRPFNLGWREGSLPGDRAKLLVEQICALSEDEVEAELRRVLKDFAGRHWSIEQIFEERFDEICPAFNIDRDEITRSRLLLIAAYFSHEYTYAAAALMNPSIVPHPDQSGTSGGVTRFVMSVRAVGEGHISSIGFREGFLGAQGKLTLWPQGHFAVAALPGPEDAEELTAVVSSQVNLSDTVIFPMTDQQQGGLEDLRLVRFDHGGADYEWIGTYTAYSGSTIQSEMVRTRDFRRFDFAPITGKAGRDKGMALFPRKFGEEYRMVGRQDGKNLFLLRSSDLTHWDAEGTPLLEPKYPWEFIQIGNCGSPIEIDEGWLLITHGVGAMRRYSLGCALLDKDDPSKVLARSRHPILTAEQEDRNGYVPNVVYTCGAMMTEGGYLFVPYGISDSAIGFGKIVLSDLLASLD